MVGRLGSETRISHLGREPREQAGLVNRPVHRGSTFLFERVADLEAAKKARFSKGQLFYGRFGTPDVFAFEDAVSELEGGEASVAVPSGLAACVLPLVAFLKPGDHVLVTDAIYEPTRTSLMAFIARSGVDVEFYNPRTGAGIETLCRDNTKVIYLESPGSLTFEVQDIPAITAIARRRGILTVCDNTWATGYFCNAFALGVDVVAQSATKYLIGHSDSMLGVVTCKEHLHCQLREAANWMGYRVSPDDVFLAARGLRTLPVRLERHQQNGIALAQWLAAQPQVRRVLHPALEGHPDHALWKRDFRGASGLFAIILDTSSHKRAVAFIEALRLFGLGFSWGGFESLVLLGDPAHARTATVWNDDGVLIRIHAGLENPDDLKADLANALAIAGTA